MRLKYVQAEPLTTKQLLQLEKEALGFYMSSHPIEQVDAVHLQQRTPLLYTAQLQDGAHVKVLGSIEDIRVLRTKKGEQMAFVTLEDEGGTISCTLFPQLYSHVAPLLLDGALVAAEGQIEVRFGKRQLKTKALYTI